MSNNTMHVEYYKSVFAQKLETIKNTSRKMSRLKRNIADAKSYEKTQTQQTTEKVDVICCSESQPVGVAS